MLRIGPKNILLSAGTIPLAAPVNIFYGGILTARGIILIAYGGNSANIITATATYSADGVNPVTQAPTGIPTFSLPASMLFNGTLAAPTLMVCAPGSSSFGGSLAPFVLPYVRFGFQAAVADVTGVTIIGWSILDEILNPGALSTPTLSMP